MKHRLTLVLAAWTALIISSCKEVSFPVPQPKGVKALTEIPEALRGKYIAGEPGDDKKDSLIVEAWGYHFKDSNEMDWLGKGVISDSLVIKFHKNYYFLNFRTGDQWVLRVVQQQPNGDIEFMSINLSEEVADATIDKLSKKIDVKELELEDGTFYQVNPSANQLMGLIKDGFFSTIVLEKK
jgi:hypothetical protein